MGMHGIADASQHAMTTTRIRTLPCARNIARMCKGHNRRKIWSYGRCVLYFHKLGRCVRGGGACRPTEHSPTNESKAQAKREIGSGRTGQLEGILAGAGDTLTAGLEAVSRTKREWGGVRRGLVASSVAFRAGKGAKGGLTNAVLLIRGWAG